VTKPIPIKLETAPLQILEALALSLARDIDDGADAEKLRGELERIMSLVPNAKVQA
jgi:hypothetical protein